MKDAPAFPLFPTDETQYRVNEMMLRNGLSRRDYFAGLLWCRELPNRTTKYKDRPAERARRAVEHADALIAELEKK